jgi:hypothetical protein
MTRPLAIMWIMRCWISEKSFTLLEGEREVGDGKGARGSSKIKLKNVNKKRMATARRLIFWNFSRHPLLI